MNHTLWRVGIATLFNFGFEYSIRGTNNFWQPRLLPIVIFLTYLSLFTIEDALIQRYRLKDYHLTILAFTYGMIYQCLISGSAFVDAGTLGINWPQILFTISLWWGVLQSVFTFYVANRLFPRRWEDPPTPTWGLLLALLVNVGMVALFQKSGFIPTGRPIGYLMMVIVAGGAAILFILSLPRGNVESPPFRAQPFLDLLAVLTVLIFVLGAFFLHGEEAIVREATVLNLQAARVITLWTILLAISLGGYRLISRRSIPI